MKTRIILLTEDNLDDFLPCILPQIHGRMAESAVFGFGIVAARLGKPEEPAGAIVCEYDTGIATVLSVGVIPRLQRRGLGSILVEHLAVACARQGVMELNTSCWSADGSDDPIKSFFVNNDFEALQGEAVRYAVTIGDIAGSPLERHIARVQNTRKANLMQLALMETPMLTQFIKDFDLPVQILRGIDPLTSCVTVEDKRIQSAALLATIQDGTVEIAYLCSQTNDGRVAAATLLTALGNLYNAAPADTVVLFVPVNEVITRLAERLLEGCKTEVLHECQLYRSLMPMWASETDVDRSSDDLRGE